jgi:hypothetical protein
MTLAALAHQSAGLFCEHCRKGTKFVPIHIAAQAAGVSKPTVYYWMERGWVHWRELPSGRRVICEESLSRPARDPLSSTAHPNRGVSKDSVKGVLFYKVP